MHSLRDCPCELNIVACFGPIRIHAGKQDFPCPQRNGFAHPFQAIQPGGGTATVNVDLPLVLPRTACIHRQHNALRTELCGPFFNKAGILDSRRIYRSLVSTGFQHAPHILDCAYAAAHCEGYKDLGSAILRHLHNGVALITGGRNIQKHQLVRAFLVITSGQFHRVSRIP